jgi:hypothetical protein
MSLAFRHHVAALLVTIAGVSSRVAAQDDAVLIRRPSGVRAYFEVGTAAGPLRGGTGVLPAAFGELLIGRYVSVGLGGVGLANNVALPRDLSPRRDFIDFGYGGLTVGARVMPSRAVHLTGRVLVAAGGVSLREREDVASSVPPTARDRTRGDTVLVVEPEAAVEINLTRWMRLTVGGSYRITRFVDAAFLASDRTLSGAAARMALRFGRF